MNSIIGNSLLIRSVLYKLIEMYNFGTVNSGTNGPYNDPETKVRNLSHLIVATAGEIIISNNDRFIRQLKNMSDELLAMQNSDKLFIMREKEHKDSCNGVIGHAWLIEALIFLYKIFNNELYLDISVEIAKKHSFNQTLCLWERPIDKTIDFTLNHQLWYGATICELNQILGRSDFKDEIEMFMSNIYKIFIINKNGRIKHNIITREKFYDTCKQKIKSTLDCFSELVDKPSMKYKEDGYHLFNIMALARIYRANASYTFFSSKNFRKSIDYLNSKYFLDGLNNPRQELDKSLKYRSTGFFKNIYGYPYNVPGFEIAYVYSTFPQLVSIDVCNECFNEQINYTFNNENKIFGNNCFDAYTINYRVYEYYRYLLAI